MTSEKDGVVTKVAEGVYDLRYERHYALPIDKVWAALTEPGRLAIWLAKAKVDLRLGGIIELQWPKDHMRGTIVALDPPRLFAFTWPDPDGAPGSIVRFELAEEAGGCCLVLTNTLLRVEYLLSVATGWHAHLDELSETVCVDSMPWTVERENAFRTRERTLADRYRVNLPREVMEVEQKN